MLNLWGVYNMNEFGTETMYDYYITMKYMFLGYKIFLSPFIIFVSFIIFFAWTKQ
jgi:hypothetical protein